MKLGRCASASAGYCSTDRLSSAQGMHDPGVIVHAPNLGRDCQQEQALGLAERLVRVCVRKHGSHGSPVLLGLGYLPAAARLI